MMSLLLRKVFTLKRAQYFKRESMGKPVVWDFDVFARIKKRWIRRVKAAPNDEFRTKELLDVACMEINRLLGTERLVAESESDDDKSKIEFDGSPKTALKKEIAKLKRELERYLDTATFTTFEQQSSLYMIMENALISLESP